MNLLTQRVRMLQRPIRFGLVGLSGVAVNTSVLWALVRGAHLSVPLASALATETAILSNFALNDRWTFRAARQYSLSMRLLRFNGVSLGGLAITMLLLTLLTSYASLHLLLANLLAIGGAMTWNYVVNSRWTWSDTSQVARRTSQDFTSPSAACDLEPGACDLEPATWSLRPAAGDIEEVTA